MKSQKSGAGAANLWQKLAFLARDYRSRTMREAAERGAAQEAKIRELEHENSELRARLAAKGAAEETSAYDQDVAGATRRPP